MDPLTICVLGLLLLILIVCITYLIHEDLREKRHHERMRAEREQVRASPCPACGSRRLSVSMIETLQHHVACKGCGASAIRATPMEAYEAMSLPSRPVRRTLPG